MSPVRRALLAGAAALGLAGAFGASPVAVAAATRHPGSEVVTHHVDRSPADVREFWTPARMRSAQWVDGAPRAASPRAASQAVRPYTDLPDRLNGRIFFTKPTGGTFTCSGTLIANPKKNLVWTAGRCVHGGAGSEFFTNWVFVPAYGSGSATDRPYGTWAATDLATLNQWALGSNVRQDFGVANLDLLNGKKAGDVVGGHRIAFGRGASQSYTAFGYPTGGSFTGNDQWACTSPLSGRDDVAPGAGPAPLGITCNLTGSASGGGWVIGISDGVGTVVSVTSYTKSGDGTHVYGPYQGNEAAGLYNHSKDIGPK